MGGRFPALAVFGLPALTVALALVVLWGLRPWEDDANAPHEVPLGIEMGVGGGKALPAESTARVAAGVPAPARPQVQAAKRVSIDAGSNSSPVPSSGPNPDSDGSAATIVVGPARAIAVAESPSSATGPAPESRGGEEVPSGGAATGEAPPEGTSSPVATPAGTGGGPSSKGPVSAGGKPPVLDSCEGDEYVITITLLDEESTAPTAEEADVEIVLKRLNEDGTTDELQLEDDLNDARALASTLEAEGNCVEVEVARPEEESTEEDPGANEEVPVEPGTSEEVPGSGEEAVEPAESPGPVSP